MQTDSIRFAGNVNFAVNYSNNNNVSLLQTSASLALQVKTKDLRTVFLILGNYDHAESKSEDFVNNGFFHLRATQKWNKFIRWEAFGQAQFNYLLGIKQRFLVGTGPRIKFLQINKNAFGYFGFMHMLEYEQSAGELSVINRHNRWSTYLTLTVGFPKINAELVTTTYYQPRPDLFQDYRVSHQTSINFAISRHLKFSSGVTYYFDSFPPSDVRRKALTLQQGIRYDF